MIKDRRKNGAITVEMAIGIVLVVAVLFITLGLFSNNIKTMIADSNFKNVFNKEGLKTGYSSFSKDYSDSQINVQIMGEQGLEMLRRKANNEALEIMQSSTPDKTAVIYLTMAINSIVGEPHICIYMKKDSDEPCPQTNPGGYAYKVNLSGSYPTIAKSSTIGYPIESAIGLIVTGDASKAYSASKSLSTTTAGTSQNSDSAITAKYAYLKNHTLNFATLISSNIALIQTINVFQSKVNTASSSVNIAGLKRDLIALLNNLNTTVGNSHDDCQGNIFGIPVNLPRSGDYQCNSSDKWIGKNERNGVENWFNAETKAINSLNDKSSPTDVTTTLKSLVTSLDDESVSIYWGLEQETVLTVFKNDHKESPKVCDVYKNKETGLNAIIHKYAPQAKITVPECNPF